MMGTLWHRSGTIERYADDIRADGAQAFFFITGTNTPFVVYQDAGEAAAHLHPVIADSKGRWPDIFIPYIEAYDVQVKTKFGVQLTYTLAVPNADPRDVFTEDPEDPIVLPTADQLWQTGQTVFEFVDGQRNGFVRANGRTIGNAASGGTERANADTAALFDYLWNNVSNTFCPVSSGRGASGAADYAANKTIGLPDMRGYGPVGLATMGNTATTILNGVPVNAGSTILPCSDLGVNTVALTIANMPAHSHTGTTVSAGSHVHPVSGVSSGSTTTSGAHTHPDASLRCDGAPASAGGSYYNLVSNFGIDWNNSVAVAISSTGSEHAHALSISTTVYIDYAGAHTHTFSTDTVGSGSPTAFSTMSRSRLGTFYIKL